MSEALCDAAAATGRRDQKKQTSRRTGRLAGRTD